MRQWIWIKPREKMFSETKYEQKYNRLPQFSLQNEKKQKKSNNQHGLIL